MTEQIVSKLPASITQLDQSTGRLFPLDLLKAMSIVAVVSYHSIFVPRATYVDSLSTVNMLFAPLRFCVPVLFTLSFMLLERGLSKPANEHNWPLIKKRLLRLSIPTVFWFSLAAGLKLLKGNSPFEIVRSIIDGTIFQGAYYLLVLFQFIPIFILLRHWLSSLKNFIFIVTLQGLVFLLIYTALLGIETQSISILKIIGRPLFIYWFIYMALGIYFCKNWSLIVNISTRIPRNAKIVVTYLNCLILVIESQYLFVMSRGSIPPFDYVMFSCPLSVVVLFLCFASIEENQLTLPVRKLVFLLSKYSLGIFCINGIMSEIFLSFGSRLFGGYTLSLFEVIVMKLAGWVLLTYFSLMLSIMFEKIGWKAVVS